MRSANGSSPAIGRLALLALQRARLTSAWRRSILRRYLIAWRDELIDMLPRRLRRSVAARLMPARLDWPFDVAGPARPRRPVALVLSAEAVMVQFLTLPVSATRHLHEALGYEIDRYLPYTLEELEFDAWVARRAPDSSQTIDVTLVAIARDRLSAIIKDCREHGIVINAIDAYGSNGERLGANLLPTVAAPRSGVCRRALSLLLALALIGCLASAFHGQWARVEVMQAQVDAQRGKLAKVQTLRRELQEKIGAARYLSDLKHARPTVTSALAALTTCLNDNTFVTSLSIDNDGITLTGQSRRASKLLDALEGCGPLTDPRFEGVIQSDEDTQWEHYSIHARLKNAGVESNRRLAGGADAAE